jgi:hypothetical protein
MAIPTHRYKFPTQAEIDEMTPAWIKEHWHLTDEIVKEVHRQVREAHQQGLNARVGDMIYYVDGRVCYEPEDNQQWLRF